MRDPNIEIVKVVLITKAATDTTPEMRMFVFPSLGKNTSVMAADEQVMKILVERDKGMMKIINGWFEKAQETE